MYEVSSLGEIISFRQRLRILRPGIGTTGYHLVVLGRGNTRKVHRLVAEAFIPNPENKPFVNHKNGNPLDNRVENLEWCTPTENARHCRHVLNRNWLRERIPQSVLKLKEVKEIKAILDFGISQNQVAKAYGVCPESIRKIALGITWNWVK